VKRAIIGDHHITVVVPASPCGWASWPAPKPEMNPEALKTPAQR
jgi:hypothetical protein